MFFTLLPAKKPKSQQMLTKIFLQVDDTLNTPQPWGFVFKSITDWKNDFFWPYWVTRRLERTTFICIETHLLYTILITIGPYSTIWAYFCTKCEGVSFLPSKGKNWTFFQKSKIDLYMAQIDKSLLWIKSTRLEDVFKLLSWYSIFKTFSFIFWAAKWELCMIP